MTVLFLDLTEDRLKLCKIKPEESSFANLCSGIVSNLFFLVAQENLKNDLDNKELA